jgi:hypothetical protein
MCLPCPPPPDCPSLPIPSQPGSRTAGKRLFRRVAGPRGDDLARRGADQRHWPVAAVWDGEPQLRAQCGPCSDRQHAGRWRPRSWACLGRAPAARARAAHGAARIAAGGAGRGDICELPRPRRARAGGAAARRACVKLGVRVQVRLLLEGLAVGAPCVHSGRRPTRLPRSLTLPFESRSQRPGPPSHARSCARCTTELAVHPFAAQLIGATAQRAAELAPEVAAAAEAGDTRKLQRAAGELARQLRDQEETFAALGLAPGMVGGDATCASPLQANCCGCCLCRFSWAAAGGRRMLTSHCFHVSKPHPHPPAAPLNSNRLVAEARSRCGLL